MNRSIFAVCDLEEAYVYNFVEYINQKRSIPFEIQAFTSTEKLLEFCQDRRVEILLISDRAMKEEVNNLAVEKLIILSQGANNHGFERYPSIYKYQSSDDVIREVMNCYGIDKIAATPLQLVKRKTEIIGIYSPVGRTAKTSFALTLGQILARERAVLYLNLEEYSGFEQLLDCKYEKTLGDLIYYLRKGHTNLFYKIQGMIQNIENLDYLPPTLSPLDIQNTTYEEWMLLINELIKNSDYETIILDFGDGVADLYSLLNECTKVYMPIRKDVVSISKVQHFEHLLGMWNYEAVIQKLKKIKLPYHHVQKRGRAYMDELVWSEMGDFVKELIRQDKRSEYQELSDGTI